MLKDIYEPEVPVLTVSGSSVQCVIYFPGVILMQRNIQMPENTTAFWVIMFLLSLICKVLHLEAT